MHQQCVTAVSSATDVVCGVLCRYVQRYRAEDAKLAGVILQAPVSCELTLFHLSTSA
jgi:hypothetical protein